MSNAPLADIASRLAARYPTRFLQRYTYWKVRTDPLYPAVWSVLNRAPELPLTDYGCGAGLFAFFLRENGYQGSILGIDIDSHKVAAAQRLAAGYNPAPQFTCADYRGYAFEGTPGHVTLLDVLQYVPGKDQQEFLAAITPAVAADGGLLILRCGLRDQSWRYRITMIADRFARVIGWMKTPPLEFPTRESLTDVMSQSGMEIKLQPLWGRTPFNNYLIIARRTS